MTSTGRQRKRFILVGCGSWGARWYNTFIPQARDIAECIAVVDLDEHCADLAGHALSIPPERRYTGVRRAFLENKVDFAVIAVSIPAHLTVIKTVLEVQPGCHILSEKPVAGSMFECRQIEALVRAAGIPYSCRRYWHHAAIVPLFDFSTGSQSQTCCFPCPCRFAGHRYRTVLPYNWQCRASRPGSPSLLRYARPHEGS